MRNPKLLIYALVAVAALAIALPSSPKFSYDYRKGSTWKYDDLISAFDFPLLKTEEQMLAESEAARPVPYFKYSAEASDAALNALRVIELGEFEYMRQNMLSAFGSIYGKGVILDGALQPEDKSLYVQKGKRAELCSSSEVYTISEARQSLLKSLSAKYSNGGIDSLLFSDGIYALLLPNLIFDSQTTSLVFSRSDHSVSPTLGYVPAGRKIVSNGEIITAELAQMIDSYKAEYEQVMDSSKPLAADIFGNILTALVLVSILVLIIFFSKPKILGRPKEFLFILVVWLMSAIVAVLLGRFDASLLFLMPFTLAALYLQAFFLNRVIVPVYISSLLPLLVATDNGAVLFLMFTAEGLAAILSFRYFNRGWKQFVTAMISFGTVWIVFFAFYITGMLKVDLLSTTMKLLLGALFCVAGYPLIYLFEQIFNLTSNSRLIELCDTSNPLIRELESKAPGTFQHSLQVMNLAEAAALAIGENPFLVRTGALYHDIGKMKNPLCFVENESVMGVGGVSYHGELTPVQSAQDIIRHVEDGCEIALKKGLPDKIVNYIRSHHGTSCVSFFYDKHIKSGGDPQDRPMFCYPGRRPVTVGETIVMLADSLEAASRTLKDYHPDTVGELVDRICSIKIEDGQFADSKITMKDLGLVREAFKQYIVQIHHERVVYPKRNKNNR